MRTPKLVTATCALALLGSGAAFAASAADSAWSGQRAQDAHITHQVHRRIDHELMMQNDAGNVGPRLRVRTHDGVVTLSGNVWTNHAEHYILEQAWNTPGVVAVRNHLNLPS
jgi:osmotically-inducible protein OsmY